MRCTLLLDLYYDQSLVGYRATLSDSSTTSATFDCIPYHLEVLKTVGVDIIKEGSSPIETVIQGNSLVPVGYEDRPLLNMNVILNQLGVEEHHLHNDEASDVYFALKELNLHQFGLNPNFLIVVSKTQLEPSLLISKANYDVISISKRFLARETVMLDILTYIAYEVVKTPEIVDYLTSKGYVLYQPKEKKEKPVFLYYCNRCNKEYEKERQLTNITNHRCLCGGGIRTKREHKLLTSMEG